MNPKQTKMAMFTKMNAFFFLLSCMVVVAPYGEAISCGQIQTNLISCVNYLRNGGPVPLNCCTGIRNVNSGSRTTPDRHAACRCIISIVKAIPGINYGYINGLPAKCNVNVNVPYTLTPSIDCNKIK